MMIVNGVGASVLQYYRNSCVLQHENRQEVLGQEREFLSLRTCDALEAAGGTAPKAASRGRRRKRTKA